MGIVCRAGAHQADKHFPAFLPTNNWDIILFSEFRLTFFASELILSLNTRDTPLPNVHPRKRTALVNHKSYFTFISFGNSRMI